MCVFFKQKTAYEMRISDWSSDVCSSDLGELVADDAEGGRPDDGEPAVALVGPPGQQQVHRRVDAKRLQRFGQVVDLAVAYQDHRRDALARHLRQGLAQRREEASAFGLERARRIAGADQPNHGILPGADLLTQVADRLLGSAAAVLDLLARAPGGEDE